MTQEMHGALSLLTKLGMPLHTGAQRRHGHGSEPGRPPGQRLRKKERPEAAAAPGHRGNQGRLRAAVHRRGNPPHEKVHLDVDISIHQTVSTKLSTPLSAKHRHGQGTEVVPKPSRNACHKSKILVCAKSQLIHDPPPPPVDS